MKFRPYNCQYVKWLLLPVPVAERSTASVWGLSPVEIVGSNATGFMEVSCECFV